MGPFRKKSAFRYWSGQLHLWLGLASGLVVYIVSITGCLFVFQKEISEALRPGMYFVQAPAQADSSALLPLCTLLESARNVLGKGQPVGTITTFKDPGRAWEFMAYKTNDTALTYFGNMEYYRSAFVNPYTGAVTGIRNYKYDFFAIVKYIHWSLLFNTHIGQPIVGWATLIFVLLLITGLVLWWPKKWNRANRRRSFNIMLKAHPKRLTYDLHNVPGFYSLLLALILGLTGMVFSFRWFSNWAYAVAAGTTNRPVSAMVRSEKRPMTAADARAAHAPLSFAFSQARTLLPECQRIAVSPAFGEDGTIFAFGYHGKETYYGSDELQFDQYSGLLLHRRNHREKNAGEKLIEMNYDIHVGAIGGLTGKLIAFVISLICASLPVTGFLVWRNKRAGTKVHIIRSS